MSKKKRDSHRHREPSPLQIDKKYRVIRPFKVSSEGPPIDVGQYLRLVKSIFTLRDLDRMLTFVIEAPGPSKGRIIQLIDADPHTREFFDNPARFLEPETCDHSIEGEALAQISIRVLGEEYDLSWGVCRCGVFLEHSFRDSLSGIRESCFVLDAESARVRMEKARSCSTPWNSHCRCPGHQSVTGGWGVG